MVTDTGINIFWVPLRNGLTACGMPTGLGHEKSIYESGDSPILSLHWRTVSITQRLNGHFLKRVMMLAYRGKLTTAVGCGLLTQVINRPSTLLRPLFLAQ